MKTRQTIRFQRFLILVAASTAAAWLYAAHGGHHGGGGHGTTTTTTIGGGGTTTTTTTTTTTIAPTIPPGKQRQYAIISVGTVPGTTKVLTLETVQRLTWAKFALWSNNNGSIYFKSGESFYGHVHSNSELYFSGNPHFYSDCTSAANTFQGSTNAVTFDKGLRLGVATDTMAAVNMVNLLDKSTLTVTGATTIVFSSTNMLVSNAARGWTSVTNGVDTNTVIYVADDPSGTNYGDVNVSGTLDGRITVVSERDINIVNHLKYTSDPKTNSASDDALGLISGRDIVVTTAAPNNLQIYAHMMATGRATASTTDGSFGVQNYSSRAASGQLTVHGGIVQDNRGAVGTFNMGTGALASGFDKNYTYDTRFISEPPPEYPPLMDELTFGNWRDK